MTLGYGNWGFPKISGTFLQAVGSYRVLGFKDQGSPKLGVPFGGPCSPIIRIIMRWFFILRSGSYQVEKFP